MKFTFRLALLFLLGSSLPKANAQQWQTDKYDSRWLPITDQEMRKQVRASARDAVSLYRLYDQARYQKKQPCYFAALQQLKQEQPKNGIVLATYCAVLMDANQMYGFGQYQFDADPKEGEMPTLAKNLAIAKKLEPKLWLIAMTEADIAFFSNGNELEGAKNAVVLCRKAVELAPGISYTQERLGYWLGSLAMQEATSRQASVLAYQKAQRLRPVNADASFLLLNVYRFYEPDSALAQRTARAVLATIAPSVKLDSATKNFLLKQGVALPVKKALPNVAATPK